MIPHRLIRVIFLCGLLWLPEPASSEDYVDLELVFALDASASVDGFEWTLQTGGIAAAIRDDAILSAIRAGETGRIAVSVVAWAASEIPKDRGPWFIINDAESAEAFARHVESFPRRVNGGTGLGAGLGVAIRHIDRNAIISGRQVVDISGDGRQTPPRDYALMPEDARGMANARKVTVNALAILTDDPSLDRYFANNVIIGPNSFVISASDYNDFQRAIRLKLYREILGDPDVALNRSFK